MHFQGVMSVKLYQKLKQPAEGMSINARQACVLPIFIVQR